MTTLRTADLAIGYDRVALLSRLDLRASSGTVTCLLGANGSGKSTLLRTIAGIHRPVRGSVLLDDADLGQLAPLDLAKRRAIVLTGRPMFGDLRVRELLSTARHPHTGWSGRTTSSDDDAIQDALHATDAEDLANRRVGELSDGEHQRVMLARALAQQPSLLLLDEPTAHLDRIRALQVVSMVRELARSRGLVVIMSTHDLDLALQAADQLWACADDAVRSGIPEVLATDGTVARAFEPPPTVEFDVDTGTFRSRPDPGKTVALSDRIEDPWVERLVLRLGARKCREDYGADITIRPGSTGWVIHSDEHAHSVPDLGSMDTVLRSLLGLPPLAGLEIR